VVGLVVLVKQVRKFFALGQSILEDRLHLLRRPRVDEDSPAEPRSRVSGKPPVAVEDVYLQRDALAEHGVREALLDHVVDPLEEVAPPDDEDGGVLLLVRLGDVRLGDARDLLSDVHAHERGVLLLHGALGPDDLRVCHAVLQLFGQVAEVLAVDPVGEVPSVLGLGHDAVHGVYDDLCAPRAVGEVEPLEVLVLRKRPDELGRGVLKCVERLVVVASDEHGAHVPEYVDEPGLEEAEVLVLVDDD
jgi:hypothetical protein